MQADDLDCLLRHHGGLEGLARAMGQIEPERPERTPAANDNARPRKSLKTIIAALLASVFAFSSHAAPVITGEPQVVDGDTLAIGQTKIRLESIDAPESDQVCLSPNHKRWACGMEARDRLAAYIDHRPIDCTATGSDAHGRSSRSAGLLAMI